MRFGKRMPVLPAPVTPVATRSIVAVVLGAVVAAALNGRWKRRSEGSNGGSPAWCRDYTSDSGDSASNISGDGGGDGGGGD